MALQQIKGNGTIVWGTANIAGNSIPAGAIISSIKLTPKNGAPIEIEDNNGIAVFEIILRDGFNGKVTQLFDATKTYPVEGANCTIAISWPGAAANAIPFGEPGVNGGNANYAANVVTYTCLIAAIAPSYEKKKEAYVDWDITYRPNVNV